MYFRTRIFAISILTVSVVLTVVATLSWSRIMKVELEHLDNRLCMEARRAMRMNLAPRLDGEMSLPQVATSKGIENSDARFIADLMAKLRINSQSNVMVFVDSDAHGVLIASEGTDIKNLIGSLDWVKSERLRPPDKNHPIRCQLASFEYKHQQWRASYFQSHNIKSFIAVDLSATTSELETTLRTAFFVVIPFSLLLSIIGAWFITTTTLRPINRLHKSMDRVTQKDLSHRLLGDKEDKEFKVLIDAYNMMLERLEDSFQQVSRFTADAAHELKTPLTVLRGKLEQAVTSENTSQLDLNAILDEVGHLSAITRKLLLLSQADSGSMALYFEPINMTSLLDELTADMELLSDELVLHCTIEKELILKGDIVLIKQLLNNLLVNVIRYSLHKKGVIIEARQNESSIEILINNFCLPMSNEVRSQLFDRFYRGQPEQLQGISGSGLGLSLAREIARAHGGDLTLEASIEDVFSMRLLLPIVK
jgi:two-component system heavy metal sensor histidine kinase CusS